MTTLPKLTAVVFLALVLVGCGKQDPVNVDLTENTNIWVTWTNDIPRTNTSLSRFAVERCSGWTGQGYPSVYVIRDSTTGAEVLYLYQGNAAAAVRLH